MTSRSKQRVIADRLGIKAEAAEWCTLDKIPAPPSEVLQAAGSPRLRPGRMPLLEMLGTVLISPFILIGWLLTPLAGAHESVMRALSTSKRDRERSREKHADAKQREAHIIEQGLDHVFDGNWQGAAGQFLLSWYTHSTCDARLVVITQDGIVLAAPPVRAVMDREKRMQVITRLAPDEASLIDPFPYEYETRMLLLSFRDGTWLRIEAGDTHSDLHKYLLRQPAPDTGN
ncbi:hypothetical protein ACWGH5_14690 [Streptomyces sp. NPDC054864]